MSERIPCEFFLIRYVPDVVKGEFTNVGVLLRQAAPAGRGLVGAGETLVRFTRDWSRVRCVDPDADIELLEALEEEIARRLQAEAGGFSARSLMSSLADSLSNSIQITEPRACLAETIRLELDLLMQLYVEPLKLKVSRQRTGRAAIATAMRREFERTGVWASMKKRIPASQYTRPGDPMKIDCGYRPNGVIRMFHAVSLENDAEPAKGFAYSAAQLRDGVQRVESATLELTAVVEPLRLVAANPASEEEGNFSDDEAGSLYRFGVEAMEQQQIRVITINDLARAAETARIELRL